MDFKKFEKLNNSNFKKNSDSSPMLKKKDFIDPTKENFEVKNPFSEQNQISINLNQNANPTILNIVLDSTNSNSKNNLSHELDEKMMSRNRRVSIRDKIKYYESQMEESILKNKFS